MAHKALTQNEATSQQWLQLLYGFKTKEQSGQADDLRCHNTDWRQCRLTARLPPLLSLTSKTSSFAMLPYYFSRPSFSNVNNKNISSTPWCRTCLAMQASTMNISYLAQCYKNQEAFGLSPADMGSPPPNGISPASTSRAGRDHWWVLQELFFPTPFPNHNMFHGDAMGGGCQPA